MLKRGALLFGFLVLLNRQGNAATAPGFAIEKVAPTAGFLSCIAFDFADALVYTTLDGSVYRLEASISRKVATVPTAVGGNEGLIGLARIADGRFAVHHVAENHTADLISLVDLETGAIQTLARLQCNYGRPCSSEHHGGHIVVMPDGSLRAGIGDVSGFTVAQDPSSAAGKIMRIRPEGITSVYASGFRNPFGIAWDPLSGKAIVADNGPGDGDEINLVSEGDNDGWPATYGNQPSLPGLTPPVYVFSTKVAPTGVAGVHAAGRLSDGVVVAAYKTKALYYFHDLRISTVADPIPLVIGETREIIAVAQNAHGEIYFGTPDAIYRVKSEPSRRRAGSRRW